MAAESFIGVAEGEPDSEEGEGAFDVSSAISEDN